MNVEPRCRLGNVLKHHTSPCAVGCEYPAQVSASPRDVMLAAGVRCGESSPGGGLVCTRGPHGPDVGHVWVHRSATSDSAAHPDRGSNQ